MLNANRRRLWLAVKSLLAIAILVGVARHFARILNDPQLDFSRFHFRVELLIPAGILYLLAHICWGTFWVRLLHGQGISVSWYTGIRAYFVSQFGKYVPGKAWVILLRVGMLRQHHAHPFPVAVTATYETLCSMAAGALLGVIMLPYLGVLPIELSGQSTALVAVAALPVVLGVLNQFAARVVARRRGPDARRIPAPSLFLLTQGLLHGVCGHCLLGLSLGLTIASIAPNPEPPQSMFTANLGAVTIAYVAGFVILVAPGGLGAREAVLTWALTPRFVAGMGANEAAAMAVVIALALRLVWTVAEVFLAACLYAYPPHHQQPIHTARSNPPSQADPGLTPNNRHAH